MTRGRWWLVGGAIVGALVLLLVWLLLVSPKRDEATAIRDQAASLQGTNAQLQSRIAELQQLAAGLPEQEAELQRIATLLPPSSDLPELVRQLSAVAAETGVVLVSVSPASPAPVSPAAGETPDPNATATGLQQITVGLQVKGPFSNVKLFLGRLETLPRAFLTSSFSIERASDADVTNVLTMNVQGAVFYLPGLPETLPGSTASPGSSLPPDASVAPGSRPTPELTVTTPTPQPSA